MAGDIERVSGRYLVGHGTELYSINLTTVAATPVILPLGVTIGSELVPDGTNPYTVTGGRLVIVNVLASPMTVRSTRLTGIPGNAEIGSMWINWTGGSLWMKVNGTGKT